MRWTDIADWIGPTPNENPGAMATVLGVVVHIQQGTEAGTEAWQLNPASQVSSHFLSPKVGRGKQMVDTADKAWTEAQGNAHWLSIENEGLSGQTLSPDQVEFNAQVLAKAHLLYNVPLQVTNDVNTPGLGHHSMGGVPWGNHPDCPGDPIIAQKPAIVARAQQIANETMSVTSDNILLAWSQGNQKGAGGEDIEPVKWRVRDEAWQAAITKAVSDLTAAVAALKAENATGVTPGTKLAVTVDSVT